MGNLLKLKTNDNHTIYWILNSSNNKNDKLIIFVHWLYADKDDDLYINASKYFQKNNFDTFRFDLYSKNKNARKLIESNIDLNSNDLETVLEYFWNNYKYIYLIGHSLWWQAIINSNTSKIKKIILWDPSAWLSKKEEKSDISYDEKKWVYIVNWWVKFEISKKFKDDWSNVNNIEKYINKITNNTYFIFAWNSSIIKNWWDYILNYKQNIIKEANHPFNWEVIQKQLFYQTLKYLIN